MLHSLTQNICCKYGSVLSLGPLRGPPAHDNRMRNRNGMNQPGGLLFPTTCVNRLVCPLSRETSGEDAYGLSTAPQKALPAPRSNKEKAWTVCLRLKSCVCWASLAVKGLWTCACKVSLKWHIFGGFSSSLIKIHLKKAPKKVKLTEQSQSNTSNESPVGQIVSKCANQSEERTDKDVH